MPRVLMICEKFPPFNLSGSARPFYFAKYLPEFGYDPTVLGSTVLADDDRDDALLSELPASVEVWRTPRLVSHVMARRRAKARERAREKAREATASGAPDAPPSRFDGLSRALPYLGWWFHWELDWSALATLAGWLRSQRLQPDIIWASGPGFRNFAVACRLAAWLNKPLVVDLRDPWTYGSLWHPSTPQVARAERAWAERVFDLAERVVFTSPLTQESMRERFPQLARERLVTITNGFDASPVTPLRDVPSEVCLFRYVGMLNERRQPDVLISAFALACEDPEIRASAALELIGSAGGHEAKVALAPGCRVRFKGQVSRAESLRYMFGSDVNVLLQTISEGQDVVSGKAFDYLYAGKPILAVVDESGGDAWLVREAGVGRIAPWSDVSSVRKAITECFRAWKLGAAQPHTDVADKFSRRALTGTLASLFDDVLAGPRLAPGARR